MSPKKSKTVRKHISINHVMHARAMRMMDKRMFLSFSRYVEQLIREDYDKAEKLKGQPASPPPLVDTPWSRWN